jgi:hypothetical protein
MRKAILYRCGVLAAVIAVFVLYGQRGAVYAALDSLMVIPRPERLSELYFVTPLPKTATVAGNTVSFSFVIHNLEGEDLMYTYHVYASSDSSDIPIDSATVSITSGQFKTITESYTFNTSTDQVTFMVEMTSPRSEHIHFSLPPGE